MSTLGSKQDRPKDAIESWLDVMVSMLRLAPSKRTQVRDELEDHLRSRVDDLLVKGESESDAVRHAISELGETAQLARHISSANTGHQPFRRFAMNAAVFILAGSFLTAGISMMVPGGAAQTAAQGTSAAAIAGAHTAPSALEGLTLGVRESTFGEFFSQIDEHVERPVVVHWDELGHLSVEPTTKLAIDSGPISATLALSILEERWERDMHDSVAVLDADGHLEIGSRTQFDHKTRERRIYDLSAFAMDPADTAQVQRSVPHEILELVVGHVSTDSWDVMGGSGASASVFGTSLIVTAPTRMHEEIRGLLDELAAQNAERHIAQERAHKERVSMLRDEFERVHAAYTAVQGRLLEINNIIQGWGGESVTLSKEEAASFFKERQALEDKSIDLGDRVEYLRKALMTLEYEPLILH